MTTSTGPKISSWARRLALSTSANSVGSTQNPSRSIGWPPVATSHPPRRRADVGLDPVALAREMTGPHTVPGRPGRLAPIDSIAAAATATASSYWSLGTTSRVVIAQPWPAWMQAAKAVAADTAATSASSSARAADFPPSSRNTLLSVGAAAAMIAWPVAVDPVNDTMSTRGSVASTAATSRPRRDHVEDAGRQVGVLGRQPAQLAGQPRACPARA